MTGAITVVSYPSRFVQLTMFLESNAEGSFRLPNVGVEGVVVTRDVVDGAAQFLLGGRSKRRNRFTLSSKVSKI